MGRYQHSLLFSQAESLSDRLQDIHSNILAGIPAVDRISCALYDPATDLVKTFINSTHEGHAISGYQYQLKDSRSLSVLAASGDYRVIDDIRIDIQPGNQHSDWLLEQGYSSSFTIPMINGGELLGFIFFDSLKAGVFTPEVQRDLLVYCNVVMMVIVSELAAVNTLLATANVAQDFVHVRDFETGAHLQRMARLSRLIARATATDFAVSDEFVEHVYLFAPLHDIGKIGIPDEILLKPGRLSEEERQIMQGHVQKGVELINSVMKNFHLSHLVDSKIMLNIVACHHELLDGSGYPQGLAGDDVPAEARIVATADIFDALTSFRPYKKAWSIDDALAELDRMAQAGKLDTRCVQALYSQRAEVDEIVSQLVGTDLPEMAGD